MKTSMRFVAFGFSVYASCAVAQFLSSPDRPNSIREPELRAIASRLVVGMPEHDAISFLRTNGLRVNATVHDVNGWSYKYCYLNDTPYVQHLSVGFRQKPSPSGLIWETNQFGVRCVARTNGVLQAAVLGGVQVARTNAL
jgi:hypothetical protein